MPEDPEAFWFLIFVTAALAIMAVVIMGSLILCHQGIEVPGVCNICR